MSLKFTNLILTALVMSATAFAGDPTPAQPARALSWEDFKSACSHPTGFGNQNPQTNIMISCGDVRTTWVADASGSVPLTGIRHINISVTSDKYQVVPESREVESLAREGSCSKFKEVTETFKAPERALTCDDVLSFKGGDLLDYCKGEIDNGKPKDPKLTEVKETGRVLDTCAGVAIH